MKNKFWMKKKGNKFGAKKTVVDGITFDSKKEAWYYGDLKIKKRAGLIDSFERQVPYDLYAYVPSVAGVFPAEKIAKHIVDFIVYVGGRKEAHEVKGMETAIWRLKKKIFEANYPSIKYVVIK